MALRAKASHRPTCPLVEALGEKQQPREQRQAGTGREWREKETREENGRWDGWGVCAQPRLEDRCMAGDGRSARAARVRTPRAAVAPSALKLKSEVRLATSRTEPYRGLAASHTSCTVGSCRTSSSVDVAHVVREGLYRDLRPSGCTREGKSPRGYCRTAASTAPSGARRHPLRRRR